MSSARAQAEPIGVILLVGVVTLAISVFGLSYLGGLDTDPSPTTNVDSRITVDRVSLTHDGGAVLDTADLRIVVRTNGTDTGITWTDDPAVGPQFDPGETWSAAFPTIQHPDAEVRVVLVHTASDSTMFETVTNPNPS